MPKPNAAAKNCRTARIRTTSAYVRKPKPSTGTSYGGAGRSVFYQTEEKSPASPRDNGAWERTANWKRKREAKKMELQEREQLRADQARRIRDWISNVGRRQCNGNKHGRAPPHGGRARPVARIGCREHATSPFKGIAWQGNCGFGGVFGCFQKNRTHAKFYGYVNFGDGKGPLELTESEYRQRSPSVLTKYITANRNNDQGYSGKRGKNVAVAVVREGGDDSEDWSVYLLNLNDFPAERRIHHEQRLWRVGQRKPPHLRIALVLRRNSPREVVKVEAIVEDVFGLHNEYWVLLRRYRNF